MKQVRQDQKLLKAVQKNNADEAKALLVSGRKKISLGKSNLKKSTESLDNSLDVVTQEKLSHIDVNYRDEENGYTPLMYAVSNENVDLATTLVHFSADVSVQDNKGNTPLHLAVFNSQSKLVQILLGKGAKVNVSNQDGNTPLHIACQHYGIGDKFMLLKLLQTKPDVTAKNKDGATPLDLAAQYDKQEAVSMLLDHEPTLRKSHRAFREAAIRGHTGVLQLMLDYGVEPNITDKTGTTALHEASRYLRYDAAKLLLTYGADPEIPDLNDETPKSILSSYPAAKIDRFLKLFQDGGSLPRLRPKYTEEAEIEHRYSSSGSEAMSQNGDNSSVVSTATAAHQLTYLKWVVPPVGKTFVEASMPDFVVEGDAEIEEDLELLVEEALVTGDNIYRLMPRGSENPSIAVFSNISMLQEGTYTLTVRSVNNLSVEVTASVTVEREKREPIDIDAAFDELEKMLQFDL